MLAVEATEGNVADVQVSLHFPPLCNPDKMAVCFVID